MKRTIKSTNKKNLTIGFLCGTFFDPYQEAIFKAVVAASEKKGVGVVAFVGESLQSPYYNQLQRNTIYDLVSPLNIDGIIALSGTLGNYISHEQLMLFYSQYSVLPLISIGVAINGISSLLVDNKKGMNDLMSHLIEVHKAKRIAFIRGSEDNFEAEIRFSVYKEALKKYGIPIDPDLIAPGDFADFSGSRAISLLLDKRKVRFDVLVSSNDRMAINAIKALFKRGIKVPEDMLVTGFDDIANSRCFIPPLTTVSQPLNLLGIEAVQLLLSKLEGHELPEEKTLQTRLVIRRSCSCPGKDWNSYHNTIKRNKTKKHKDFNPEQSLVNTIINMADNDELVTTVSEKEIRKWIHTLKKALDHGLETKEFSDFTKVLDTIFIEMRNRKLDILLWNYVINSLCDYASESDQIKSNKALVNALRKISFEILGKAIERGKEYENIKYKEQFVEFYRITQEIISGFHFDTIKKSLIERIPCLGLKSCYIALYKIDENNILDKDYVRLVVAFHNEKEIDYKETKEYYPSKDIIPNTLRKIQGNHTFVIISIIFQNELLGFGVFEHGPDNLLLYENLVVQLSGALQEVKIIEQIEQHTYKLEQEVMVSVSALEKTTHQLIRERDERKKTEKALRVAREQALVTLRSIGDGVITTDTKGIITYLNPVAEELTGWENSEAIGKPLSRVFNVVYRFSDKLVENPVDIALGQDSGFKISGSIILKNKDLREYDIEELISPIRDFNNKVIGVVLIIRNVSETQRMSRELSYQRTHDQLTGLINRIRFEELLKDVSDELLEENNEHCLCFLDIDSFRIINDACGHAAGDELIKKIGSLLRSCVRQSDVLSRLGGDQFGLLLIACPFIRAKELAENILNTINAYSFSWKGTHYRIRLSIGLVYIDSYSEHISRALIAANFACHLAKKKGGSQLHVYHADDEDSVKYQSEMHFIPYITKAIKEDRFCLYKQVIRPIGYGIPDNDHYEILLRMKDEKGNIISPGSFLQIAERYNLMPEIDRWVVEKLFSSYEVDYYETPDKAYAKYSINISGVTLNDEKFLHFVIDKLNEYRIPPYMICFEITETAAISNFSQVILFIKELKKIGCFFSLDDFGSGWASFNYLKILPVDFLKIEGSFVREIAKNPLDFVLVQTMNHIGHVIGLKTIAEYVENEDIIIKLKTIGVDYAQGFGIARPEPF